MITSGSAAKAATGLPMRTANIRRAYKVREAADILGCSEISVRRLIKRGLLRPNRALRHLLIPAAEIDRFLQQ